MAGKRSFTQESTWVHTWMGLITGWLLVPIFLTGSICVFWHEVSVWARPESHAISMPDHRAMIEGSVDYLRRRAPDARQWQIQMPLPENRDPILTVVSTDAAGKNQRLDVVPDGDGKPEHGRPVVTHSKGGRLFVDFHWSLLPYAYVEPDRLYAGCLIVAAVGIAFLVLAITGVVIHKRIFKDFFLFRPVAKSGQRTWLDAHNVLGVLPFPFHILIVVTGLAYFSYLYAPAGLQTLYDGHRTSLNQNLGFNRYLATKGVARGPAAPMADIAILADRAEAAWGAGSVISITIRDPGRADSMVQMVRRDDDQIALMVRDRMDFNGVTGALVRDIKGGAPVRTTWDIISCLHFAYFGGAPMRWLYLVCGLAGTAMIATGLVLFTVKRQEKARAGDKGFFLVAGRINIAAVAGSAVACAAYMWAIRLLPAGMAHRPDWEVNIFLLAWAACGVHAFLRPSRQAWVEQFAAAAALCVCLPALGFLVPNSALPTMIMLGDWKTAGVDLTALVLGLLLAYTAYAIGAVPRGARLALA